jgi:hypothetical protein
MFDVVDGMARTICPMCYQSFTTANHLEAEHLQGPCQKFRENVKRRQMKLEEKRLWAQEKSYVVMGGNGYMAVEDKEVVNQMELESGMDLGSAMNLGAGMKIKVEM